MVLGGFVSRLGYPRPPVFDGAGVPWVFTGTHQRDAPSRQDDAVVRAPNPVWLVLLWSSCRLFTCYFHHFASVTLYPLSGQIMCNHRSPLRAARLTLLLENYVVGRYHVTKLCCAAYVVVGALSAWSPCNLGPSAYFAVSIFRELCEHLVLPRFHFW